MRLGSSSHFPVAVQYCTSCTSNCNNAWTASRAAVAFVRVGCNMATQASVQLLRCAALHARKFRNSGVQSLSTLLGGHDARSFSTSPDSASALLAHIKAKIMVIVEFALSCICRVQLPPAKHGTHSQLAVCPSPLDCCSSGPPCAPCAPQPSMYRDLHASHEYTPHHTPHTPHATGPGRPHLHLGIHAGACVALPRPRDRVRVRVRVRSWVRVQHAHVCVCAHGPTRKSPSPGQGMRTAAGWAYRQVFLRR